MTTTEGQIESFLEMLYRHQEQQRMPVVGEDFLQRLVSLGEEEQYKAMEHISRLTGIAVVGLRDEVYQARLSGLYKVWYEDQVEEWVNLYYQPPISQHYWDQEKAERLARSEREERPVEVTQEELSLEELKKELGVVS